MAFVLGTAVFGGKLMIEKRASFRSGQAILITSTVRLRSTR